MSRIPRTPAGTAPAISHPQSRPSAIDREVLRLVRELTPIQRHLLVRAGLPRWMRLATPWHPTSRREAAEARRLASRPFAILEPLPRERGAYQLTPLGELVAGLAIINVLTLS